MAATNTTLARQQTSELLSFDLLNPMFSEDEPRLGRLNFQGRAPTDTPHYVAVSSRGAVPHLSQDMMRDNTKISAMYAALEDSSSSWSPQVIEKASQKDQVPPIFNMPATSHESPLRKFIALQRDALLILGPRRIPPLPCPASSTHSAISIVTSLGFGMLEHEYYVEAVQKLRPDIVVGLVDVLFGHKPGTKRKDIMGDRTLAWVRELIAGMRDEDDGTPRTALFVPILPIEAEQQSYYLDALQDDFKESISGLALYDNASVDAIPRGLWQLPRFSMGDMNSPHEILHAIALGVDMFTIAFITEATDAGIALDFSFPVAKDLGSNASLLPLGVDMWSPNHAADLSPLSTDCECYSCTNHHRAFVQHLLNAKEMLGWVLLQLHSHHVIDNFFVSIRSSIQNGSFEEDRQIFEESYTAELPAKTGQGPRVRGYQFKSEKGESRKNQAAYRSLDDSKEKLAEAAPPSLKADAQDLEQQGFAEQVE